MKVTMELEGERSEVSRELKLMMNCYDMYEQLWDIKSLIRQKLKHGDPSDAEERLLLEINGLIDIEE